MKALRVSVPVLTVVWLALWGRVTTATVGSGLLLAVVVSFAVTRWSASPVRSRPVAVAVLLGWFSWMLVRATLEVAWEVITPTDRTRPGFITVPLRQSRPGLVTLVANMVSLTPGTLTIEADTATARLRIHVMHLVDAERSRAQVRRLEALVAAAFATESEQEETP